MTPLSYIGWGKTTQLGYGLGLAMGAKLAHPDKLCINLWGDAAIGFTGLCQPLLFAHARMFFPEHLLGRGITFANFLTIGGAGVVQFASGAYVSGLQASGMAAAWPAHEKPQAAPGSRLTGAAGAPASAAVISTALTAEAATSAGGAACAAGRDSCGSCRNFSCRCPDTPGVGESRKMRSPVGCEELPRCRCRGARRNR